MGKTNVYGPTVLYQVTGGGCLAPKQASTVSTCQLLWIQSITMRADTRGRNWARDCNGVVDMRKSALTHVYQSATVKPTDTIKLRVKKKSMIFK